MRLNPIIRGLSSIIAIIGILAGTNTYFLLLSWFAIIIPLDIITGIIKKQILFITAFIIPIFFTLVLVWGWLLGAPPGSILNSSPLAGVEFAALVSTRFLLLSSVFLLCLSIPAKQIGITLRSWGFKKNAIIIALGAFAVWPEIRLRANQIIEARFARALVPDRKFLSRLKQIPHIMVPMLNWILRSSIQRSEAWHQRHFLLGISSSEHNLKQNMRLTDIGFLTMTFLWTITSVLV